MERQTPDNGLISLARARRKSDGNVIVTLILSVRQIPSHSDSRGQRRRPPSQPHRGFPRFRARNRSEVPGQNAERLAERQPVSGGAERLQPREVCIPLGRAALCHLHPFIRLQRAVSKLKSSAGLDREA